MSDFQKYKKKRMKEDPDFWKEYDERLETFKLGILLKQARLEAGLTQEEIAKRLRTTKSVVSRMENHSTTFASLLWRNSPRPSDEGFMSP